MKLNCIDAKACFAELLYLWQGTSVFANIGEPITGKVVSLLIIIFINIIIIIVIIAFIIFISGQVVSQLIIIQPTRWER